MTGREVERALLEAVAAQPRVRMLEEHMAIDLIHDSKAAASDLTDRPPGGAASTALGYSAGDCVVVEDVPAGIRAGKATGATVIAFRTTLRDPELLAAGADWLLNNCSDISVAKKSPDLTLALVSDTPRTT